MHRREDRIKKVKDAIQANQAEYERRAKIARERDKRAREQEKRDRERQQLAALAKIKDTALGAGLVATAADYDALSHSERKIISDLCDLSDALRDDLISAVGNNAVAEKGVAYGRPAAAGASVLAFLNGYGWAGLALGAASAGARLISNDWKKAKVAEYRAKWMNIMSQLDAEQINCFTRIFSYKYPALTSIATDMQRLSD